MDLGPLTAALQRAALPAGARAGEPMTLRLATLLPVLERAGAAPELLGALRGLPPATLVQLVLPLGGGAARLQAAEQRWAVPPDVRAALQALLADAPDTPATAPAAPRAAVPPPAVAAAPLLGDVAAAQRLAALAPAVLATVAPAAEPSRGARRTATPTIAFDTPLLDARSGGTATDAPDVPQLAAALAQRVAASGLFFEAQLARWAQAADPATTARLQAEAQRLAGADEPARTAAQLALHERAALQLHGPAWPGQPAHLTIEHEAPPRTAPETVSPPACNARLELDLPQLGRTAVRLRLVGQALTVHVDAAQPAPWRAAGAQLRERLGHHGLQVAQLAIELPAVDEVAA